MANWLDFAVIGGGHAGTAADPWDWTDFVAWLGVAAGGTTVWTRGTIDQTGTNVLNSRTTAVTMAAWDTALYGPWRLKCGNFQAVGGPGRWILSGGVLSGSTIEAGSIQNMVLYNAAASQYYATPCSDSLFYWVGVVNVPSGGANTWQRNVIAGAAIGNVAPPGFPMTFLNSATSAANIAALAVGGGGGVDGGGMIYGQVFVPPAWDTADIYDFDLYPGFGPNWAQTPTPTPTPSGRSVHDITKAFARLMFTPLMQTGKAWIVCNVMGSGRQAWTDAWDAMDDTAHPGDTAADLEMRQWLRKVFLSTIMVSRQGAAAPILPYMGGGGTRMILTKETLGEAVRYAQMP